MKKIFVALLVVLMVCSPVFSAINIDLLTQDSKLNYLSNSLSIQTEKNIKMSTFGSSSVNAYTGYGTISAASRGSEKTVWYPYKGSLNIPKSEFFKLVGQDDLARQSEEIARFNKNLSITVYSIAGVGAILSLVGMYFFFESPYGTNQYEFGNYSMYAGLGLMTLALPLCFLEKEFPDVSISFAIGLSDIYNQKLLESLSQ